MGKWCYFFRANHFRMAEYSRMINLFHQWTCFLVERPRCFASSKEKVSFPATKNKLFCGCLEHCHNAISTCKKGWDIDNWNKTGVRQSSGVFQESTKSGGRMQDRNTIFCKERTVTKMAAC